MKYGRAKERKQGFQLNKTFEERPRHQVSLLGTDQPTPQAEIRPITHVAASNLTGPARGYETGIRGLLGGEVAQKSYSVERIGKHRTNAQGASPYQFENQGKSRYQEHMSVETKKRLGLGVAPGQPRKFQTQGSLKLVQPAKKQYLSVWDALQLKDVEAFKEDERVRHEKELREKEKMRAMLTQQMREHEDDRKKRQAVQQIEYQNFKSGLDQFDRKTNLRNSQMRTALAHHKLENQLFHQTRQQRENMEKVNQVIEESKMNETDMRKTAADALHMNRSFQNTKQATLNQRRQEIDKQKK